MAGDWWDVPNMSGTHDTGCASCGCLPLRSPPVLAADRGSVSYRYGYAATVDPLYETWRLDERWRAETALPNPDTEAPPGPPGDTTAGRRLGELK